MEGTPFGRYQLLGLLGRGGMGEVWRAHDTATDRIVAIKLLPAQYSDDPTFQQRFRREAQAAARLNSPHVIPIYDYGEIDGRLYVTMRLVEGRDLHAVLTDGPLQPGRAVRIIEQVAKALHAAHKVGLVHRDVKPSNVLLDEDDFAYLIDFGIARATDDTRMTGTGNAIGTFQYMAPERMDSSPDDARADVYALACVLYECLTGEPPFSGNMASLVSAHLNTPPPRPSATITSEVNPAFDLVIATGMAKKPDARYRTTNDLATAASAAISASATNAPTQQRPESALPGSAESPRSAPVAPIYRVSADKDVPPAGVPRLRQSLNSEPTLKSNQVPSPQSVSRKRVRTGLIIGAAIVVVAVVGVTTSLSNTDDGANQPVKTSARSTPPLSTTPPSNLDTLLSTTAEANKIMNTSDLAAGEISSKLYSSDAWSYEPPMCEVVVNSGSVRSWEDAGFGSMREQSLTNSSGAVVGEDVFKFESADVASRVLAKLAATWEQCRNEAITLTGSGTNPAKVHPTIATLSTHADNISVDFSTGQDHSCQHIIEVIDAYAVEVLACNKEITNQAQDFATLIANKIKGS